MDGGRTRSARPARTPTWWCPVAGGVLAVDLGTDAVYRHPVGRATGELIAGEPVSASPPGTGPRHLLLDPAGRLHVVGELSATVVARS